MDIEGAKNRIWNSLEKKLPERGLSQMAKSIEIPRLSKAQSLERILSALPDREAVPSVLARLLALSKQRRVMSMATLSLFFAFIFAPLFQVSPTASAEVSNELEVVEGTVTVTRGTEIFEVKDRLLVKEGDRLETGEGAMAHVKFVDDSRLTLAPNSEILLTELYVAPSNRARTEIVVDQLRGRVWSQVLSVVSADSFYVLRFPGGEAVARQRASFDVKMDESSTTLQVVRNLVETVVSTEEEIYQGMLGQGAELLITDRVETYQISEEDRADLWWSFNLSYENIYAAAVEASVREEAISSVTILPGHPLYKIKTLQETLQSWTALTEESKKKSAVNRAEMRLMEAKALVAQGEGERAAKVLESYNDALSEVDSVEDTETLMADLEETKKELLTIQGSSMSAIDSLVSEAQATMMENPEEANALKLLSSSQKLQLVPDLVERGDFTQAIEYLASYKNDSLNAVVDLNKIPLEEREPFVQQMLDQKLKDLQLLRVISAMPEISASMDIESQVIEQMSLMVLSLRERELDHLTDFVSTDHYGTEEQIDLYTRLKETVDLQPELDEQMSTVEEAVSVPVASGSVMVELTSEPILTDPRLEISHADETEHQTETSEESTDDPETHDNL